ncbi:MAG TPA: hypothetical protein VFK42_07160 [Acidimicrobiales bacterium]|nr:hypothetical protein [Acidimicrobiales bacterium]
MTGTALDATGRPLANTTVTLRENRGVANDVLGFFAAVFSLGASCAAGADPCRASGGAATTTDAAGHFGFDAATVTAARGRSRGVVLQFGDAATDGAVAVQLNPTRGGDLGELRLWNPELVARQANATGTTLAWRAPPLADTRTVLRGAITDGPPTGATRTLAQFAPHGPSAAVTIDRRALEDRAAVVVLTVGFSRDRAGQRPRIDWTAPLRSVTGAGAPLSRGAPCTADGTVLAGCPATDGDLTTPMRPEPAGYGTVTVDLRRAVVAGTIAVRTGTGAGAAVDVSTDGRTWTPADTGRPDAIWPAALFTAGGRAVRYVRVRPATGNGNGTGGGTVDPSEISVWPATAAPAPAPAAPAAGIPPVPGADGGRPRAATTGDGGSRVLYVAAAILLLLAVAGSTAFLLGRRDSQRHS